MSFKSKRQLSKTKEHLTYRIKIKLMSSWPSSPGLATSKPQHLRTSNTLQEWMEFLMRTYSCIMWMDTDALTQETLPNYLTMTRVLSLSPQLLVSQWTFKTTLNNSSTNMKRMSSALIFIQTNWLPQQDKWQWKESQSSLIFLYGKYRARRS